MSRRSSPINAPEQNDCLLVSHLSYHNAVYVDATGRKERDIEKLEQGELDEKMYNRGLIHDPVFLVPVPIYYGCGTSRAARSGVARGSETGCETVGSSLLYLLCSSSYRLFR